MPQFYTSLSFTDVKQNTSVPVKIQSPKSSLLKLISCLVLLVLFVNMSAHAQLLLSKSAKEVKKAEELISKEQYEDALKSLNTALELSKGKDDYLVFYLKGYCEYNLQRLPQAIEQFNFALSKINSKDALPVKTEEHITNSLFYRATAYDDLKDYTSAINDWQLLASVKDKPILKSKAYENWAKDFYTLDKEANLEKAELLIAKAIEVDEKNATALVFQAELAMSERGYEEAIASLEKAILVETDAFARASSKSMLALCKYRIGNRDEALAIFKEAVENAPESTKWKIYQQQANLVIANHLYDPSILSQAKLWSNRAAILSEDCSNNITFAYVLALNNELVQAKEILKSITSCENNYLRMSKSELDTWINDLAKVEKQNVKVKAYGNNTWYYWGGIKAGMAEGAARALSRNFLYEIQDAKFLKGEMVSGTLKNVSDGWSYTGSFKGGVITGSGKITFADGETFTGRFASNQPNGKGKWEYTNGSSYEGDVINGTPDGVGKYQDKDGTAYEGQFQKGKPHGKGFLTVSGKKESVGFTNGERTDAAYIAQQKAERERLEQAKKENEALAMQRMKEEELAKAEKRNNTGKIIGKTLALAGGAVFLKQAMDLGMSTGAATELGAALVSDVLTDGKSNALGAALAAQSTGNPLAATSNAASTSQPGSGGDCNCANSPLPQKYKRLADQKIDVQTNTMCAALALYECLASCPTTKMNKGELNRMISTLRADINRMTDGKGCK